MDLGENISRFWILLVAVCVLGVLSTPADSSWWLLGTTAVQYSTAEFFPTTYKALCRNLSYLVDKQKELCITDQNVLKTVAEGAALGTEECQHQFANKRWNCTTYSNSTSVFGAVLNINSREKAYVYAISSAGVAYTVTKACSQGEIAECGCDKRIWNVPPDEKFEWGGCSDDLHFGARFSKDFVDSRETKHNAEGLMNLHNNEAGRRHLRNTLQKTCKCHGVSGACTIRVCWRKLSTFRKVGDSLTEKFGGAVQAKMNYKKGRLRPKHRGQKFPMGEDLVFLEKSPDYCERSLKYGITGTRGRQCNRTSHDVDGCGLLCCGRGYRTMLIEETKECNCKFVWCCKVQCEKCVERKEGHICN